MTIPPRIQRLLEGRQMETVEPDPEAVVGFWLKALASSADSRKGLHPDNAVSLGYQAAFQASTAVLECAGFRTRGSQGHGYPGLEGIDVESERIRKMRTLAFYDAVEATEEEVRAVHRWLDSLLPAARQAFVTLRPDLAARLPQR